MRSTRITGEGKLEWVARKDFEGLPLVEDLAVLLPRLFTMRSDDPPFYAHYWYDSLGGLHIEFRE